MEIKKTIEVLEYLANRFENETREEHCNGELPHKLRILIDHISDDFSEIRKKLLSVWQFSMREDSKDVAFLIRSFVTNDRI